MANNTINTINKIKVSNVEYDIIDQSATDKLVEIEEKLETIEEGAQVNVIETVQLNGSDITPNDKSVNIVAIEGVGEGEQVIKLGSDNKITTDLSISYDSDAKEIKLMSGDVQVGDAIDATAFIKDGMVDSAKLEEREGKTYLVISFNTDGDKDKVDVDVTTLLNIDQIDRIEKFIGNLTSPEKGLNYILDGYNFLEGNPVRIKSDIENLERQINAIHTHDNKNVLDCITVENVQAWDDAEQNAKDYAKDYTDAAVEAQALVDAAQDKAITDGDAATLKSANDYADENFQKVMVLRPQDTIDQMLNDLRYIPNVIYKGETNDIFSTTSNFNELDSKIKNNEDIYSLYHGEFTLNYDRYKTFELQRMNLLYVLYNTYDVKFTEIYRIKENESQWGPWKLVNNSATNA